MLAETRELPAASSIPVELGSEGRVFELTRAGIAEVCHGPDGVRESGSPLSPQVSYDVGRVETLVVVSRRSTVRPWAGSPGRPTSLDPLDRHRIDRVPGEQRLSDLGCRPAPAELGRGVDGAPGGREPLRGAGRGDRSRDDGDPCSPAGSRPDGQALRTDQPETVGVGMLGAPPVLVFHDPSPQGHGPDHRRTATARSGAPSPTCTRTGRSCTTGAGSDARARASTAPSSARATASRRGLARPVRAPVRPGSAGGANRATR